MRLIDADELYKHVMEAYTPEECATKCAFPDDFITRIDSMPTIDQWHYPSRGEYPRKGRQILAYAWNVHNVLAKYDTFDGEDRFVTFDAYNGFIEIEKVIRWQYIIPPKEEA